MDITLGTPDVDIPSVVTYKLRRIAAPTIAVIYDDSLSPPGFRIAHYTEPYSYRIYSYNIYTTPSSPPLPKGDEPTPVQVAAGPPVTEVADFDRT